MPLNVRGTERWNAAFAYLDEARGRPNLTILDRTLVDRVELEGDRAVGVVVHGAGGESTLRAGRVIVSAGAYGSPAILLRSGIGPPNELRRHGIEVRADLPVGSRLRDHFGVRVRLAPSKAFQQRIDDHAALGLTFVSQGILKARSSRCSGGPWDLHGVIAVMPAANAGYPERAGHVLGLGASLVKPAWTGTVRLRSADPRVLPEVSPHGLGDGNIGPYFHPVGTCAMGHADDGVSTVDASGRVHGIDGLSVADASIIPSSPRANTNMPTLVVAERIAESL